MSEQVLEGWHMQSCASTMDQKSMNSSQNYSTMPTRIIAQIKKVQVVYYLSYRGGLLEQPHLLEICLPSSRGLRLRDVKTRLASLRGGVMSSSFSWSYKRSYKEVYVWQDLECDNDLIFPTHNGSEYVMKGCRIESSSIVEQIPASSENIPHNLMGDGHGISTPRHPTSRLAGLPALPTVTAKVVNLVAVDDHANNKIIFESPSNYASFPRCDDNIAFNLGVIEGLEHLHFTKVTNLNNDYAESQASSSLTRDHIAKEQNEKNVQTVRLSKEPSASKLPLKGPIMEREPYDSPEFSVIKKAEKATGTFLNPSLYVGADAATQTGEDDETTNIIDERGKGKLLCLPDLYHEDNLPACSKRREGSFFKQRVSLNSAMIELSRQEISPPPCSTSSSSMTSAHSASSSNAASGSVDQLQKLDLDKSKSLGEDQDLHEIEILQSSRDCSGEEALLNEEKPMALQTPLDSNHHQGKETASLSADSNENSQCDDVDDRKCKNLKSALSSSKIKPHMMNLCSNSGRFLHRVSCGRGLEVITPSDRRAPCMSNIQGDVCEGASGRQQSSLFNADPREYSCLDLAPLNGSESGITCLPIAANNVPSKMLCHGDSNLVMHSHRYSNSGNKKLWQLRSWVHSNCKKNRNFKSKIISTNSVVHEDTYTCSDLFEKHVANPSTDGINEDCSSSRRMLIQVGSAD